MEDPTVNTSKETAVEKDTKSTLTNRQREFARNIVEGVYSNAECARRAGYSKDNAVVYAYKLLNGKDFPSFPNTFLNCGRSANESLA